MRVFVSSLIIGMEPLRAAVVGAVRALGHEPVTAEAFGARAESPQITCLSGVRESDCVVLVLGGRYGAKQPSGLSATHEEFREARDRRPVFVFIDADAQREPEQDAFIAEVQQWQGGQFTESFSDPEELRNAVTRALHRWELLMAGGGPDPAEMLARATALLPREERNRYMGGPSVAVSVTGGPRQPVLRPVELEDGPLRRHLHQTARFGPVPIFVEEEGAQGRIDGHAYTLAQKNRSVRLDEEGSILLILPLQEGHDGILALIEEDVRSTLLTALQFASGLLDHIDNVQRLSHVAIAARILDSGARGWRTRREHAASPNQGTMSMHMGEHPPVSLSPPIRSRAALRQQAEGLAEDLTVLLRRQYHGSRF